MQPTTIREYDHNGNCVGCGEDQYQGCGTVADCPLVTGEIRPSVVLRAAAQRLKVFPIHRGADIDAAIELAAGILGPAYWMGGGPDIHALVHAARTALVTYFDHVTGPDCALPTAEMVGQFGRLAPRSIIAATLYVAAAHADGSEFEAEDGEFDSYDD